MAILIGRIIAVAILFVYYVLSQYVPVAGLVLIVIIVLLIPVLMVRSLLFQLRNTSYHGLRFNFQRNDTDSFITFYGGALITIFSLGLAMPSATYISNKFVVNNAGFGQTLFNFNGRQGKYYAIFWSSVGLAILGGIGAFILVSVPGAAFGGVFGDLQGGNCRVVQALVVLALLPLFGFYAAIGRLLRWPNGGS